MIKIRKITSEEKQLFSENLKKIRESKNISSDELAKECNVKTEILEKWENGEIMPNSSTIKKISDKLDIDPDKMINRSPSSKLDVIENLSEETKSQIIRLLQVFIKTRSDINKNEYIALINILKGEG